MKIRFLGTGTSTGVPEIGCRCEVCTSSDGRDKRLRTSALITVNGKNILIDCGPDFRQQMLPVELKKLHGVLLTHEHYDHVGGMDDLRPFCRFGDIDVYLEKYVSEALKTRIPYCFEKFKYPGVPSFNLHEITCNPFYVEDVKIVPVRLMHYKLPITGYRIGNMAYLTDVKSIPEEEYKKLEGLDTLIMDALRIKPHISHQNLEEALENIRRINPKRTYFIHMSHQMGLHGEIEKKLPENIFLAYDGLEIESD
ncbi:MBL fold metallo-hydrolase [Dysgonomonas sp. 216]|uniref:MBL fold metallo-hydrolase n=1 Tax=Dysgonomonas sp. 216 TaxID=2302934 RepID=UPI0013D5F7F3|nr:MBL fold metallo-hydrolase [Dysgonomonas sp. 216]NDW18620.1 MBL fold metallo-hydrolase [Dysgonomonas sp. 216]